MHLLRVRQSFSGYADKISSTLQEVNRILLGLNCGKKVESIDLPQPVKALSSKHDFDLQVGAYI